MKETKNVSKSIIYEGNDRILLSESNLRSGFPVAIPLSRKATFVIPLTKMLRDRGINNNIPRLVV